MPGKKKRIKYFDEKDYNWLDTKDLEKYREKPTWLKKNKSLIYGSLSCGFLTLAVFEILIGLSSLMFLGFLVLTVLSIVIDSKTNFRI